MTATIKTVLHRFSFDTRNEAESKAWQALRASLKGGPREMESHGGGSHYPSFKAPHGNSQSITVHLETSHLFDNQWNTSADTEGLPNYRVFDFAFDYQPNGTPWRKRGHWIEQTDEMREARRNTMACGYCGKQEPAQKGYVFCPHCLDSEYLKETELHLTRMVQAGESFGTDRAKLSDAERAHLLPLYRDAQLHGNTERGRKRIAAKRAGIADKYKKAIHTATMERDGFSYLMDKGINTDLAIYYSHTDKFSFGWREPVGAAVLSGLIDALCEFPFAYEIKCADGRTLTGA